jgi:hypothetical protein
MCIPPITVKCIPPFIARQWLSKHIPMTMNTCNNNRIVRYTCQRLSVYPPILANSEIRNSQ